MNSVNDFKLHFLNTFNSKIIISPLDFHELPDLVARTMAEADKYPTLNGSSKRLLVISALTGAINKTTASDKKKASALAELDNLMESFIVISKGAITVDKNEIVDSETKHFATLINDIYNKVETVISDKKITVNELIKSIPYLVTVIIKNLKRLRNLNGTQKKQIALGVIHMMLDKLPLPRETDENKAKIKLYGKMASSLIETALSVADGKIDINQIIKVAKTGFALCKLCC